MLLVSSNNRNRLSSDVYWTKGRTGSQSPLKNTSYPSNTSFLFVFWGLLIQPEHSNKKGTLVIKGLVGK